MDLTQQLDVDKGAQECRRLLLEHEFHSTSNLVKALAYTLHTDEDDLWKGVRDLVFESHNEVAEVVDQWLLTAAVSRKQYLSCVVNRDSVIDGLFVWLAARWRGVHLNIVHATGIWITRQSDIVVMMDTKLVFIMPCFLSTCALQLQEVNKLPLGDSSSEFIQPFSSVKETEGLFVGVSQVLNDPVQNCVEHADETRV